MQVAKFPIIGMNQDDDDVNLKPGWCREIWNAIPKNGYSKTGIQNLKGSTLRENVDISFANILDNPTFSSSSNWTNTSLGANPDWSISSGEANVVVGPSETSESFYQTKVGSAGDHRIRLKLETLISEVESEVNIYMFFYSGGVGGTLVLSQLLCTMENGITSFQDEILFSVPGVFDTVALSATQVSPTETCALFIDYCYLDSTTSGVCIGTFPDKQNNRIVYFIASESGDDSIWYFDPITNTHTLIMRTEYFNFDTDFPILSCTFNDDIMEWTDNNNEARSLIVSRAVAGSYDFTSQDSFEKQVSLYKTPPRFPPTSSYPRETGTSGFNNITSDSFQFAVQYVYYDNTVSLMSPLSKLNQADIFPASTNTLNRITISHTVDTAIYGIIKKIYWIYLKNDDGNFQIFREIDLDTVDPTRATPTRTVQFYGTDTVETIFPAQVNFIPYKSKNIVIHNQRSIATMNEFDYAESSITLSLINQAVGTIVSTQPNKICAPNSSYTAGFIFFDTFGRTPGISAKATIVTPSINKVIKLPSDDQNTVLSSDQLKIGWSVSGSVPSWAKTCAIALKLNNTIQVACATLAFPFFYKRTDTNEGAEEFEDNGKIYKTNAPNGWAKQIYWKIPINLPFIIDGSFKMRIINNLSSYGQTRASEDIIRVEGDKIITENFGITEWGTMLGTTKGMINVIFEKYKEEQDEVFFEVGQHFDCSSGSLAGVSGTIEGDYFYIMSKLHFNQIDDANGAINYGGIFGDVLQPDNTAAPIEVPIISQSPTHSTITISDVQQTVEKTKKKGIFKKALGVAGGVASVIPGLGIVGAAATTVAAALPESVDDTVTRIDSVKLVYTPDYNKVASDSGRGWIDVKNKQISYEPNTLTISDPYVINSKVNGLSDYRNLYQIPSARTEITKLVSIGASNILLAIHERTTTSIATYSGRILNTTDGSQLIGDGNDIVGYNNELAGGCGTIYPDSVVHHYGRVWYFDPFSGEVVRYANNGLTPIGSVYKMHNFFREKGNQFVDPTGRNVIAGYDANLDILYLTFRSTTPSEEITVAFIDRQGEERWISFTDFLPERYAYINERLFGFVDGQMWEMNINETRNLFFGVQYTTSVKHLFNAEFSHEKRLLNVNAESNKRWVFDPILTDRHNPVTDGKIEQETSLAKSNFVRRDNGFYADLKRDKNTPSGLIPAGKSALVAGQPLIGKVYEITLENDDTELVELDFLNYGYFLQSGHNIV